MMKQKKSGDEKYKRCSKCGKEKLLIFFNKRKDGLLGRRRECATCQANDKLVSRYGITFSEYEKLLKKQKYQCYLCGTDKPKGRYGIFVVDHCHSTKKIRALLCHHCNTGLGAFCDDVGLMKKAISYIKEFKRKHDKGQACRG